MDNTHRMLPPSKERWEAGTPFQKGYWSYMFSEWPNSEIPSESPFQVGSADQLEFDKGQHHAMLIAQDSEE